MTVGVRARPRHMLPMLPWLSLVMGAFLLCGCAHDDSSFMHPYGMVASAQRQWLIEITVEMMIVVLPVFVLMPLFAWRYRRRNTSAAYRPKWEFFWPLEIAIWGFPTLIVVALAVLIVIRQTPLGPYASLPGKESPLEVQVVALDWKWLFIYPEQHIATVSTLAIPVDRPVSFRLTSDSTMQSFFIPALGSQIYVMAGMVTQLHLIADRTGSLLGENTQFNGMKFQNDKFIVKVMSPDAFKQWAKEQQAGGKNLDPRAYRMLAEQGTTEEAKQRFGMEPSAGLSFSGVASDFFRSIVAKYNPGAMHSMHSSPF